MGDSSFLLDSFGLSVFPQNLHCLIHISIGLIQSLFTIHHAGAGLLTQLLYHSRSYFCHFLFLHLIGIGDTNCDPEELDYIIPGNDDAIRAVKLIVAKMADAVVEANQGVFSSFSHSFLSLITSFLGRTSKVPSSDIVSTQTCHRKERKN